MTNEPVLSVLDLVPVAEDTGAAAALAASVQLAVRAEELGYHRYWLAEHHNMPGIASSAPAVLIGRIAAATSGLRVGSGGVMLPNHPPLVVAEQFGTLQALHPGRIDLGIGRAPGTDPGTARALRRIPGPLAVDDFPDQLAELTGYFSGTTPITAVPAPGHQPQLWLLGSSGYSARLAAALGWRFAFAQHINPHDAVAAIRLYRAEFRPSADLATSYAMVCTAVVCAPSAAEARHLAGPAALARLDLRRGRPRPLATPQRAAEQSYSLAEQLVLDDALANTAIGTPAEVADRLRALVAATGADELMVTSMVGAAPDRVRSHALLAAEFG